MRSTLKSSCFWVAMERKDTGDVIFFAFAFGAGILLWVLVSSFSFLHREGRKEGKEEGN